MGGIVISLVRAAVIAAVVTLRRIAISVIIAGRPIIIAIVTIPVSVAGVVGRIGIIRISVGSVWVTPVRAPQRTPAPSPPRTPTPPPWKAEVADKDDLVEIVEAMKLIISIEVTVIETVEATKPIIPIEISVARALEARG